MNFLQIIFLRAVRLLLTVPSFLYFKIRAHPLMWKYLNRVSMDEYRLSEKKTQLAQERISYELENEGIALTTLKELFPEHPNLLDELKGYVEQKRSVKEIKTKKMFLRYLWDPIPNVDIKDPFFKLALDEQILSIVNRYMGMYAVFTYATLNITLPVPKEISAQKSQLWHRDLDDRRFIKMFIYLSDVDDEAGPFTYIRESPNDRPFAHVAPQRPPKGRYPSEATVRNNIPRDRELVCIGSAGTVIFCDTSGIHRGGYSTEKERIMFTTGFVSPASPRGKMVRIEDELKNHLLDESLPKSVRNALKESSTGIFTRFMFWIIKN